MMERSNTVGRTPWVVQRGNDVSYYKTMRFRSQSGESRLGSFERRIERKGKSNLLEAL